MAQTPKKVPVKRVKQMADSLNREADRKTIGAYSALKKGNAGLFSYGTASANADRMRAERLNKAATPKRTSTLTKTTKSVKVKK